DPPQGRHLYPFRFECRCADQRIGRAGGNSRVRAGGSRAARQEIYEDRFAGAGGNLMAEKKIPRRDQNKPQPKYKVKIKKEDTVKVIAGRDKGKTGRVLQVDRERGRVLVEHVGMIKRHTKDTKSQRAGAKGGIVERESSIAISNVMILTSGGVATRVGY